MYPDRELIRLALHRKILGRRIARRRAECVAAAAQIARPFAWLDRALACWRRLPSLAPLAVPSLAALVTSRLFPGRKGLNLVMRWGSLAVGAVRAVRTAVAPAPAKRN